MVRRFFVNKISIIIFLGLMLALFWPVNQYDPVLDQYPDSLLVDFIASSKPENINVIQIDDSTFTGRATITMLKKTSVRIKDID